MIFHPWLWDLESAAGVDASDLERQLAGDRPWVVRALWPSVLAPVAQWAAQLPAAEQERLARLRQPEDRLRFLLGRLLLRRILGAHFHQAPEQVVIRTGPFGKPFAPPHGGIPAPHFNIAHAGEVVLLAIGMAHEVGVDVEVVQAAPEWAALAPRLMPAPEHRAWLALPPEEQTRAFFAAWTRHEAGLKALGLGLTDDFSLPRDAALEFAGLELPAGYAGALSWRAAKANDAVRMR